MIRAHKTKEGKIIPLRKMTNEHLRNTILFLERRAREGVLIRDGGGDDPDSFWYVEYMLYDEEALQRLGHQHYLKEWMRREKVGKV